jgi:hypothetical protein
MHMVAIANRWSQAIAVLLFFKTLVNVRTNLSKNGAGADFTIG